MSAFLDHIDRLVLESVTEFVYCMNCVAGKVK